MAERFLSFNDEDVDEFIKLEENVNTKKKTEIDFVLIKSFIMKENERRPFEELSPQELDLYLSRFRYF